MIGIINTQVGRRTEPSPGFEVGPSSLIGILPASPDQVIGPSGIPSAEAFGSINVIGNQAISPGGIASAQNVGSHRLVVSGAPITFVNVGTGANGSGNISVTLPSGLQNNDLGIIVCNTDGNAAVTFPAGWAKVDETTSSFMSGRWAWKRLLASESGTTVAITKSDPGAASVAVWRGVIGTGNPYSTKSVQANASASAIAASTITPASGETVLFIGALDDNGSSTAPAGSNPTFVERLDYSGSGSNYGILNISEGTSDGAATGARSSSVTGSGPSVGFLLALTPDIPTQTISVSGIASGESIGSHYAFNGQAVFPSGIGSQQGIGAPIVAGPIIAPGIPSKESFGTPNVYGPLYMVISGITSKQAFGNSIISKGAAPPTELVSATGLWTLWLADATTMTRIAPLTYATQRRIQMDLNRPGTLTFTYPLSDPTADSIQPVSTCVMAYRDGVLRWSGPVWATDEDPVSETLQVRCTGWLEILNKRVLWLTSSASSPGISNGSFAGNSTGWSAGTYISGDGHTANGCLEISNQTSTATVTGTLSKEHLYEISFWAKRTVVGAYDAAVTGTGFQILVPKSPTTGWVQYKGLLKPTSDSSWFMNITSTAVGTVRFDDFTITELTYQRLRLNPGTPDFASFPGLVIAEVLDELALDTPACPITLGTIQTTTPAIRRTYKRFDNVGRIIQELTDVENGVDIDVDPATRKLNVWNKKGYRPNWADQAQAYWNLITSRTGVVRWFKMAGTTTTVTDEMGNGNITLPFAPGRSSYAPLRGPTNYSGAVNWVGATMPMTGWSLTNTSFTMEFVVGDLHTASSQPALPGYLFRVNETSGALREVCIYIPAITAGVTPQIDSNRIAFQIENSVMMTDPRLQDYRHGSYANSGAAARASGYIYHFVRDHNADLTSIYVNGILAAQSNIGPFTYTTPATAKVFGDATGSQWVGGYFDEIVFYNRALSADEVIESNVAAGFLPTTRQTYFGYNSGPGNISSFGRTRDVSSMANRVAATGKIGSGTSSNTDSFSTYGIILEDVVSLSNVSDSYVLATAAAEETIVRGGPRATYSFALRPDAPEQPFIDFDVGDTCYLSARWPDGTMILSNQLIRVFGFTIDISDEGVEVVSSVRTAADQ